MAATVMPVICCALGDDVGAHFAGADEADADRPARFLQAAGKIGSETRRGANAPARPRATS